jgi:hypothetical protein
MDVAVTLQKVASAFSEQPFDFFNENDIQARTYEVLRDELRSKTTKESLPIEWKSIWSENPIRLNHDRSYVEEAYHNHIQENFENLQQAYKGSPMSRVHTEVHISQAFKGDLNEIVDIAILNQPLNRPPRLNNGKVRIEDEAIDTLIELKRPQDPITPMTMTPTEIADASAAELQAAVDLDRLDIKKDIAELEKLAGANTYQDAFLLICSPYDLFRRAKFGTNRSHERRGNAAIAEIRNRCEETAVLYAYPGGMEWIVDPE